MRQGRNPHRNEVREKSRQLHGQPLIRIAIEQSRRSALASMSWAYSGCRQRTMTLSFFVWTLTAVDVNDREAAPAHDVANLSPDSRAAVLRESSCVHHQLQEQHNREQQCHMEESMSQSLTVQGPSNISESRMKMNSLGLRPEAEA